MLEYNTKSWVWAAGSLLPGPRVYDLGELISPGSFPQSVKWKECQCPVPFQGCKASQQVEISGECPGKR